MRQQERQRQLGQDSVTNPLEGGAPRRTLKLMKPVMDEEGGLEMNMMGLMSE